MDYTLRLFNDSCSFVLDNKAIVRFKKELQEFVRLNHDFTVEISEELFSELGYEPWLRILMTNAKNLVFWVQDIAALNRISTSYLLNKNAQVAFFNVDDTILPLNFSFSDFIPELENYTLYNIKFEN